MRYLVESYAALENNYGSMLNPERAGTRRGVRQEGDGGQPAEVRDLKLLRTHLEALQRESVIDMTRQVESQLETMSSTLATQFKQMLLVSGPAGLVKALHRQLAAGRG
jgi:hypothetical protein